MGIWSREQPAEREARKAKLAATLAEEERQARIRDLRERVTLRGYGPQEGRVEGKGGYGVTIHDDGTVTIGNQDVGDYATCPLAGASASLETLEQARDRVTVTRVLALGVFALAVPKRDRRRILVVTGPGGFEAAVVVDATDEVHLRQWVAWFNRQAAKATEDDA